MDGWMDGWIVHGRRRKNDDDDSEDDGGLAFDSDDEGAGQKTSNAVRAHTIIALRHVDM